MVVISPTNSRSGTNLKWNKNDFRGTGKKTAAIRMHQADDAGQQCLNNDNTCVCKPLKNRVGVREKFSWHNDPGKLQVFRMQSSNSLINTESSLKIYFHEALSRESEKSQLEITEHTLWYLTNLLYTFSRSEKFFDYQPDRGTLTPLADYYQRAIEAKSVHEKRLHLQRLGDVAMFISGMFSQALKKRVVGVPYYMAMGETAYATLADTAAATSREQTQAIIFSDLSERFSTFVNVLSSIGPQMRNTEPENNSFEVLLQKVDEWQRTGDPDLANDLRNSGILLQPESGKAH